MDSREKALEELKRRIEEQKARVDPRLLKLAEKAAWAGVQDSETRPYDRAAAVRAVEIFLEEHRDRKGFERKLAALIFKSRN